MKWLPTLYLWSFGLFKVPLILFCRPKVIEITEKRAEIAISLNYFTRNHLKSMYFGTLAVGADCAGGLLAMYQIRKSRKKVSLIFKDFKAEFLKRPEARTHFLCGDGEAIEQAVAQTVQTGERVSVPLTIIATTPKISGEEPVARFQLTLSLKVV